MYPSALRRRRSHDEGFPWNVPVVAALGSLEFDTPVTFFVGENGSGKSTVLEGRYGEDPDARSHGEVFVALLASRLTSGGLYFLDEREAPLSPRGVLQLIALIKERIAHDCQFIIATHSPMLLAFPGAAIQVFDGATILRAAYSDVEHVQLVKAFLNDPQRFLQHFRSNIRQARTGRAEQSSYESSRVFLDGASEKGGQPAFALAPREDRRGKTGIESRVAICDGRVRTGEAGFFRRPRAEPAGKYAQPSDGGCSERQFTDPTPRAKCERPSHVGSEWSALRHRDRADH